MTALTLTAESAQLAVTAKGGLANGRGEVLQQHYDVAEIKCYHFHFKNTTGTTIAQNAIIGLGYLQQGRILPNSKIYTGASWGTSTTLSIGLDEYKTAAYNPPGPEITVAANQTLLVSGADAHTAAINSDLQGIGTTAAKGEGYILDGWALLVATIGADTMASNATLDVFIFQMTH